MYISRRPSGLTPPSLACKGSSLTIGNFDGVHRGHAALFEHIAASAKPRGWVPTVLTFEPHPKAFFDASKAPQRISPLRDKLAWMKSYGVEHVRIQPFNRSLAAMSPETFIQEILIQALNVKHLWVGDDFRFGAKRAGDFETLLQAGQRHGFEVERISSVILNDHRVSSTDVRSHLAAGQVEAAVSALGHPLTFSGHVIHGKKLGRTLSFPTLNLRPWPAHGQSAQGHQTHALSGILAVWVHGLAQQPLPGVASMGVRPSVDSNGETLLETHVFDWSGDAYGQPVTIEVMKHLRPELKFDGLDALTAQMHIDAAQARAALGLMPSQLPATWAVPF